ncbi:MAG: hypothetical protein ACI4N3_03150 [Alphaproteobacteria bacterium]
MIPEELLKKAKELGISDEEIAQFIQNQKDAEKYGFIDDCTSFNVQIDKNLDPDEEEDQPHHHENCCCHHHEEDDEDECDCCSHEHCNCHNN